MSSHHHNTHLKWNVHNANIQCSHSNSELLIHHPDDDDFHREWTSKNWPTLDAQSNRVLLLLERNSSQFNKYKSYPIEGAACEGPSSVEISSYFLFLMAFAQTMHKGQGHTLDKVTLSLMNVRKLVKFSQIFVEFSRVVNYKTFVYSCQLVHLMIWYHKLQLFNRILRFWLISSALMRTENSMLSG